MFACNQKSSVLFAADDTADKILGCHFYLLVKGFKMIVKYYVHLPVIFLVLDI